MCIDLIFGEYFSKAVMMSRMKNDYNIESIRSVKLISQNPLFWKRDNYNNNGYFRNKTFTNVKKSTENIRNKDFFNEQRSKGLR